MIIWLNYKESSSESWIHHGIHFTLATPTFRLIILPKLTQQCSMVLGYAFCNNNCRVTCATFPIVTMKILFRHSLVTFASSISSGRQTSILGGLTRQGTLPYSFPCSGHTNNGIASPPPNWAFCRYALWLYIGLRLYLGVSYQSRFPQRPLQGYTFRSRWPLRRYSLSLFPQCGQLWLSWAIASLWPEDWNAAVPTRSGLPVSGISRATRWTYIRCNSLQRAMDEGEDRWLRHDRAMI